MPKTVPRLVDPASGAELPRSTLPFSQVVEANGPVFLAGQVGNAPGLDGPVPGGIEPETRQMLENVGTLSCGRSASTTQTSSRRPSTCASSTSSRR